MGFQPGKLPEELRLNWNQLSEPRKEEIKEELESILQELEALGAGLNQENKIMNEVANISTTTALSNEDFKGKALEYLSSMGNTLPKAQQTQFIEMASAFGLNPFKREIYAVGYGEKWNIITGYEVYLKRAERIGKLDGWEVKTEGIGEAMTATVTIHRKDWKFPFTHTVLFSEVANKTKEGKLNSVWAKMPSFMCKKVAIAQAFRLCFPDEFGGMPYTSDEISSETEAPAPTEAGATEALKEAKKVNPDLEELTKILTESKYSNGQLIFTEEDKARAKASIKNYGVKKTLADCKEILSIKLESENKENQ